MGVFGVLGGPLRVIWGPWGSLGAPWGCLVTSVGVPRRSLGSLGRSLGVLWGGPSGPLGGPRGPLAALRAPWAALMGPSWSFGRSSNSLKNHCFFVFWTLGAFEEPSENSQAPWRAPRTIQGLVGETRSWIGRRVLDVGNSKAAPQHDLRHVSGHLRLRSNPGSPSNAPILQNSSETNGFSMIFKFHEGVPRALSVALGRSLGGVMWVPGSCLGRLGRSWGVAGGALGTLWGPLGALGRSAGPLW